MWYKKYHRLVLWISHKARVWHGRTELRLPRPR